MKVLPTVNLQREIPAMLGSLIDQTGLRCPNNVDADHDASVNLKPAFELSACCSDTRYFWNDTLQI